MVPEISVILTTYNRPKKLHRAINSVLKQTVDSFELIIIDDASSTDTQSVVDRFNDNRIKFIQHNNNRGGSAARNTGIKNSSGNILAFLDDDDIWKEEKLEEQIKTMKENNYRASYTDVEFVSEYALSNIVHSFTSSNDSHNKTGGQELIPYIICGEISIGGASTIAVRREIIKDIGGFDETYNRLQDWEFIVRLLDECEIKFVDKDLVKKVGYNPPSGESILQSWEKFKSDFPGYINEAKKLGLRPEEKMASEISHSYIRNGEIVKGIKYQNFHVLSLKHPHRVLFSIYIGLLENLSIS